MSRDRTPDAHDFPTRRYDLVKEFVIALIVVLVLSCGLAAIFSSPDEKAITMSGWAKADPDNLVTTAAAELAGTTTSASYGPPYNSNADGQKLGPIPMQKLGGVRIPINSADLVLGPLSQATNSPEVTAAVAKWKSATPDQQTKWATAYSDAIGTAAYVLGGFDGQQGSATVLRTVDGTTFTVVGTVPVTVRYPAVAVSGGSIWLFGGEHAGRQITDVQRIDLATGRGRVTGHLPRPLAHAGAFTLGGSIFVAGGRTGSSVTDTVLRFNAADSGFTAVGHLPADRSDFGVAVVGGTAYLVGGESPKPVDTVIQVRAHAGGTP